MLIEIMSPAFKIGDKIRKPIRFKEGLNVILGAEDGTMSIGKSSTLLAIDFVFGGKSYIKSDGVKKIGHHAIFFTFEFDGKKYFFARNTNSPDTITICDKNYNSIGRDFTKEEYCNWLKEKYGINFPGLSFRIVLSSFFRIYGKKNTDETNPLQGIPGYNMEKSIAAILSIFNKYGDIEIHKDKLDEQKKKLEAYKTARKYEFISNLVGGKTQYDDNLTRIRKLEAELDSLRENNVHSEIAEDIEKSNKKSKLIADKFRFETDLQSKERKLQLVDMNLEYGLYPTEADLFALKEYFPDVNLKKIYEVEKFHKKLAKILDGQFENEKIILKDEILKIQTNLEIVKAELKKLGVAEGVSKEFLDRYSEIKGEIDALKNQNKAYLTLLELRDAKSYADEMLRKSIENILRDIESELNGKMKSINDTLFKSSRKPPHLHFYQHNSYKFETPDDTGTGSNYKGMIVYDLAMLSCTALPAIAHDSVLFKNLEKDVEDGIIRYYDNQTKQVFIAYDKQGDCRDETRRRLEDNTVLRLSENTGALYGRMWNKLEN